MEASRSSVVEVSQGGRALPRLARAVVEARLRGRELDLPLARSGYLAQRAGVFVTILTDEGRLRGCRGTIQPQQTNLVEETRAVALSSAFADTRFSPVLLEEMPGLVFEVSVLHPPEPVSSLEELDPARYGVIVSVPDGRRGLMLPGVEGLETSHQQVEATRRKAGIGGDEPIQLARFRVDKFQEAEGDGA